MHTKSDNINELATALCQFQGELGAVAKNTQGHGYKYTAFEDMVAAIRESLAKIGLSYTQMPSTDERGYVSVETMLMHSSGQWIASVVSSPPVSGKRMNDTQGVGATITYLRRYSLSAILGIPFGDDTDAATPQAQSSGPPRRQPASKPTSHSGPAPIDRLRAQINRVFGDRAKECAVHHMAKVYNVASTSDLTQDQIMEWGKQLGATDPMTSEELEQFLL